MADHSSLSRETEWSELRLAFSFYLCSYPSMTGKMQRSIDAAAKAQFLAALRRGESRKDAAFAAGFSLMGFYGARRRDLVFRAGWTDALATSAAAERRVRSYRARRGPHRLRQPPPLPAPPPPQRPLRRGAPGDLPRPFRRQLRQQGRLDPASRFSWKLVTATSFREHAAAGSWAHRPSPTKNSGCHHFPKPQ
jgi:hypothetical protein